MTIYRNPLIRLGVATLVILALLKLLWSGFEPTSLIAWALSFAWPLFICLGIVAERRASLSRASPWRALALITTLLVGFFTLAAIGLPLGKTQIGPFLIGFFVVVLAVICIGWWRLLTQPQTTHSKERQARPWLLLTFGILTIAAVTLHKLGLVGA